MLKHVLPALEKLRLRDATAADIQKLASSMFGKKTRGARKAVTRSAQRAAFTSSAVSPRVSFA